MSAPGMSVALDLSAVPSELGGVGRYGVELAAALARRDDLELTVIRRRNETPSSEWPVRARTLAVAPRHRPTRLVFEEVALSSALRRRAPGVNVLHAPHYTTPRSRRLSVVTTVHDLTFVEHPEWHGRAKAAYFSYALARAAKSADVVICVSQQTADRFIERYAPRAGVHVAPHGVDHARFAPTEPAPGADRALLAELSLGGPYVLHLGTIEPRKNVPALVRAFDRIGAGSDLRLVLAGKAGWGLRELDGAIGASPYRERIVRLGHVEDRFVPALLRCAALVAYPSLEEGFGIPALEALACGTPLVTTKDTVMAELAGEAALVVNARSDDELVFAIESVLEGSGVAERRATGIGTAAAFTWERSAERHVVAYREALSR